jgi:hypothetical protein
MDFMSMVTLRKRKNVAWNSDVPLHAMKAHRDVELELHSIFT